MADQRQSFKEYAANEDSAFDKSVEAVSSTIKKAKESFQTAAEAVKEIAQHNGHTIPSFADCWKAVCAEADGKKAIRIAEFQGFLSTVSATFENVTSKVGYGFKSSYLDIKDIAGDLKASDKSVLPTVAQGVAGGLVTAGVADYLQSQVKDDSEKVTNADEKSGESSDKSDSNLGTDVNVDTDKVNMAEAQTDNSSELECC